MMNQARVTGRGFTVLAVAALPLLMGAKGGCGVDEVSMGHDTAGAAGDDGTAGGGAASGGKRNSGGSGGAMAQGGRSASGGTGGVSCEGYEDTTFSDEVTVRYVNASAEPFFVGRTRDDGCGNEREFAILDEGGATVPWADHLCQTCSTQQHGPVGCPTICFRPELVRIDPGGSYDFSWTGITYETLEMPRECYSTEPAPSCVKVVQAAAGSYSFVGTAFSEMGCNGMVSNVCTCQPTDTGACRYPFDGFVTGAQRQITGKLAYPADKLVVLRFE